MGFFKKIKECFLGCDNRLPSSNYNIEKTRGSLGQVKIIKYEHHGIEVYVRNCLQGRHRDMCLCYACYKFKPEDDVNNCPKANRLYRLCIEEGMVTPVFECPDWEKINKEESNVN